MNNFYGAMKIFVRKNFSGAPRLLSSFLQIGIYARSAASYTKRFFRYLLYPLIDILLLYLSMILSVNLRFEIFPNREYMIIISVYVLVWLSASYTGFVFKKYFYHAEKLLMQYSSDFYQFIHYLFFQGICILKRSYTCLYGVCNISAASLESFIKIIYFFCIKEYSSE
ncbi:MAG: hypothetical protein IPL16_18720 [Ignavibacteria bacterium]|nr:hypothetical protein [Ignavibacteria bacterium]